jgi:hypothetical protein
LEPFHNIVNRVGHNTDAIISSYAVQEADLVRGWLAAPPRLFHFDGPESAFRRAGDHVRDALLAERQGYIMLGVSFPDPDIAVLEDNGAQS